MHRTPITSAGTDGPTLASQEPSTRKVSLGSPAPVSSGTAGEPILSPGREGRDEAVFADLKARIGSLWETGADPDAIRALPVEQGQGKAG